MNPADPLDRLAAEVALEAKVYPVTERRIRLFSFALRVEALLILDDATLEQIAEGKVPESPPSPMPRGSEMMLNERGRR